MTIPERIDMLPGDSSFELHRRRMLPFGVAVSTGVPVLLVSITSRIFGTDINTLAGSAMTIVALVAAAAAVPAFRRFYRRRREEEAAGYTLFPRRRRDLAQLDPLSGVVLRAAGESFPSLWELSRRTWAARRSSL